MAYANEKVLPKKEVPKVHSCATWAMEKLCNLDIPEINETIQPTLLVKLADQLAHVASFHVGDKDEMTRAVEFYSKQAQEQYPLLKEIVKEKITEPYTGMMQYGAEQKKVGVAVGVATGALVGGTATATIATTILVGGGSPNIKTVVAATALSTCMGVTTATIGTENMRNALSLPSKREPWVEKTQSSVLDPQEEDIRHPKNLSCNLF